MKITKYFLETDKQGIDVKIACVADLHARNPQKALSALKTISPDVILLAGDIMEVANKYMAKRNKNAISFLQKASQIAPCFYCFGNHEIYFSHAIKKINRVPDTKMQREYLSYIEKLGIRLINDCFEELNIANNEKLLIGGVVCGKDKNLEKYEKEIDAKFLKKYDENDKFKILLCHYPHYYEKYLKNTSFDLILSGHAHGGQWRFFGQGLYAPHQGLLPKYTSGIFDGRFIISKGATNNAKPIPRLFNSPEVLEINVKSRRNG